MKYWMVNPEEWVKDARKWLAQADAVITDNNLIPSESYEEYQKGFKAIQKIIKAFDSLQAHTSRP